MATVEMSKDVGRKGSSHKHNFIWQGRGVKVGSEVFFFLSSFELLMLLHLI